MDEAAIRAEVERLAPWYYAFDLHGVRTDATPACDDTGHRRITFPAMWPGFWTGKTVLDVGCAEGAWTFGALANGAAGATSFDCRPAHVAKAEFVARVLGHDRARFLVSSADRWPLEHPGERFDVVLFCGIVYHLPEPWTTIARYCAIARDAVFVSTPLWGGGPGWTRWQELDNIAASEDSLDSYMPNDLDTLVAEFARHGFTPIHVEETGHPVFPSGCGVVFANFGAAALRARTRGGGDPGAADVHCGWRAGVLHVSLYGRRDRAWPARVSLAARDANAAVVFERRDERVSFPARVTGRGDPGASPSLDFRLPVAAAVHTVDAVVQDDAGRVLVEIRLSR